MKINNNSSNYELFQMNMTINTDNNIESQYVLSCKSCQCNCRSCIGCKTCGNIENSLEKLTEKEKEEVFENLFI